TSQSVPNTRKAVLEGDAGASFAELSRMLSTKIVSPSAGEYAKTSSDTTLPSTRPFSSLFRTALHELGYRSLEGVCFPGRRMAVFVQRETAPSQSPPRRLFS